MTQYTECASGCVVECRTCNRDVAGSDLGLGYFAPGSTQPSIPPGSVHEYQLRLGRQRQVWLIPIAAPYQVYAPLPLHLLVITPVPETRHADRCYGCGGQVMEVSIMYEISDYADSPDVEYPSVPPKHSFSSLHQQQNAIVAGGSSASYASINHNGKVSQSVLLAQ